MLELTRIAETTRGGGRRVETLGHLAVKEASAGDPAPRPEAPAPPSPFTCVCIELPDRENQTDVSRIPAGRYPLVRVERSPSFDYPHLWIREVPDRAGVKVHIANYARQLRGCVAPGLAFRDLDGDGIVDVTSSRAALDRLLETLPLEGNPPATELHIKDVPDEDLTRVEPAPPEAVGEESGSVDVTSALEALERELDIPTDLSDT